jgi:hypothetical protein
MPGRAPGTNGRMSVTQLEVPGPIEPDQPNPNPPGAPEIPETPPEPEPAIPAPSD